MSKTHKSVSEIYSGRFGDKVTVGDTQSGILTLEVGVAHWLEVCRALRDEEPFCFEQLTDLCGVDHLSYGQSEWETDNAVWGMNYPREYAHRPLTGRYLEFGQLV